MSGQHGSLAQIMVIRSYNHAPDVQHLNGICFLKYINIIDFILPVKAKFHYAIQLVNQLAAGSRDGLRHANELLASWTA